MKKFNSIILAVAALAFAAVSCEKVTEVHQPGEPDVDGCYGVYFPVQETSGYHVYDPTQEAKVDFVVSRSNSEGSITVPVEAIVSEEGIFQIGELKFEDGQSESTLKVDFSKAPEGKKFSMSLTITDPLYVSNYAQTAVSIDFSFMRVAYIEFPGTLRFSDVWWGEEHDCKVRYYEVDGVRYCETYDELIPEGIDDSEYGKNGGLWGTGDYHLSFNWYVGEKNVDGYDFVEVPPANIGDYESDLEAYFYYTDNYHYYTNPLVGGGNNLGTFLEFAKKYGETYPLSYYDGCGGFFFYLATPIEDTGYWSGYIQPTLISDAFVRVDYSIEAEAELTVDGVTPIYFTLGPDVADVKYAVYEGELTSTQIGKAADGIADGSVESESIDMETASTGVTMEKTGKYTLVAVAFDESGKAQESTSLVFTFVAEDSPVPVVVSAGLGSAKKYASEGISTDGAVEFYVSGSDLVEVKVGIFSLAEMTKYDKCVESLLDSDPVSEEVLEAINESFYVDVFTGLTPGTEFYMMVWASNGYEETIIVTDPETTTGDPLPIYMNYSEDDYAGEFAPEDETGFYGEWNYYAKDVFLKDPLRSYCGKVTISDSEYANEGPDDDGYYDEYVTISGLAGQWASEFEFDDSITFDYYAGVLYHAEATTVDGETSVYTMTSGGSGYSTQYIFSFLPVGDGYFALIPDSKYASYGFTGLGFDNSGLCAWMNDILLVDPAKDDNGVVPPAVEANIAAAKKCMAEISYVELPQSEKRTVIKNMAKGVCGSFKTAGIKGEPTPYLASFKTSKAPARTSFSSQKGQKVVLKRDSSKLF